MSCFHLLAIQNKKLNFARIIVHDESFPPDTMSNWPKTSVNVSNICFIPIHLKAFFIHFRTQQSTIFNDNWAVATKIALLLQSNPLNSCACTVRCFSSEHPAA